MKLTELIDLSIGFINVKKYNKYAEENESGELHYIEDEDVFFDPKTEQYYEIELIESPEDPSSEIEEKMLSDEYLHYDPELGHFVDEEAGKSIDIELEDIEDEIDHEDLDISKTSYHMNLHRRRPQRGIHRVTTHKYYTQHKPNIKRYQKMYRMKNKRFLKTRVKRIHHPTSR